MTIKVIIFDLGGVIVELNFSKFYKKIISLSSLENPHPQIMMEYFQQSDLYHQGKMSNKEFFEQTCELFRVHIEGQSTFFDIFNSIISHPIPESIELLKKLKNTNKYKLMALSNVNSSHWNYILNKKWEFLNYFNELILSHEVHMTKPDLKIYQLAIKKANCKPKEILFVDDGLNNVRSAKELGIRGIHFTNIKNLIKELNELKILIN